MVWGDVLALFLRPRNPFPGNEDRRRRRLGSNEELMRRKSEHLVLAGPFGRQVGEADDAHAVRERPSIAALTRSGATKATKIVMLTSRALQPSRVAMLYAFAVGSAMSSLSQRRPRAIDAIRRARFSERIARAC